MDTSKSVRKSPRTRRKEDLARRQADFEASLRPTPVRRSLASTMPEVDASKKKNKKKRKIVSENNNARKKKKKTPPARKSIERHRSPPPESDESDEYVLDDEDNSNHDDRLNHHDDDSNDHRDEEPQAVVDHDDQDSVSNESNRSNANEFDRNEMAQRNIGAIATSPPASDLQPIMVSGVQTTGQARMPDIDEMMHVRGLSRSQSLKNQQKHVAERVRAYVKSVIFRKIKFVNSDAMFNKAIELVMDHEDVPERQRVRFQMLYDSVFNEALNTKRSSCEQSGGKIFRESMKKFEESGEDFFTIEELTKLRRATTDRERRAFFWFFGTFLECVCGRRSWGKQKNHELISQATEKGGRGKVVTKSDEAFALLLFENYIDKWKAPPENPNDRELNAQGKRKQPRQRGKYTAIKSGHCKYGGWSHAGMARFNELYKLVEADRASNVAEAMEKELLAFCRRRMGLEHQRESGAQGDQGHNTVVPSGIDVSVVEAAWDLDD
jgi:hypothetical protein